MIAVDGGIRLAATDLAHYLGCRHQTQLDRAAAEGRLKAPVLEDPVLEALIERGLAHEKAYEEHLRAKGREVVRLEYGTDPARVVELMEAGTDVIAQAPLTDGQFFGIADFLIKVDRPSKLGRYSYEVSDTKLAMEAKAGTILQLSLYSELVGTIQGATPERMHVVRPGTEFVPETFRCDDYSAYYRLIKDRLSAAVEAPPDESSYPMPVAECAVCKWWQRCKQQWKDDDHLAMVAGMSRLHMDELLRQKVLTLAALGTLPGGTLPEKPDRGAAGTYERLHHQARVQLRGRSENRNLHELLDLEDGRGLLRLPMPSAGDVFFDIEAARFHEDGGLEYLFGWCVPLPDGPLEYRRRWALTRDQERRAFEEFMDEVMARWNNHPGMHVYHFTPYEPSALKRLMGRYGTREAELDRLLRGGRLIDLHGVARQGVRASVEEYSLKELERFPGYRRAVDLREAARGRRRIEAALDGEHGEALIAGEDRDLVEGYNREDCEATAALRGWLEERRAEWAERGTDLPRPPLEEGEATEKVEERDAATQAVYDRLVAGLPEDRESWTDEHEATFRLAEMLNYFRREDNCGHWEFHRVHDLDHDALLDERKAITGLEFDSVVPVKRKSKVPIHRYRYPEQETALEEGDRLYAVGEKTEDFGNVAAIDDANRTVDIKKRGRSADIHPLAVMADDRVPPGDRPGSLLAFAESVAEHGIDGDGSYRAGRDLLLARPPRRPNATPGPVRHRGEELLSAAKRLAGELEGGILAVQGPPGSGKTYTGARMILALAKDHRIGVTAVSHKVIRNLLDEVAKASAEANETVLLAEKVSGKVDKESRIVEITDNAKALAALDEEHVVGGTAWLWSRDEAVGALDYLFVDEAGQMSMADVLAMSRSARNIVLLGDPQQLEQPQQAAHPEGTEVAALTHLLDGKQTIPEDRGLFLDTTWRLSPDICRFTSELYYEGRLEPKAGNDRQALAGPTMVAPGGLFLVPVDHAGNQSDSPEEVRAVEAVVKDLLQNGVTWTDRDGAVRALEKDDILIVAPYNAQVAALKRALPDLRIGTVDKFQGQEAPVVIYSTTSSSPEDAPRGMRFLYDPHRLNVASSRAMGAVILVASPRLFEPECRTPEQMRWANGLCRYRELADQKGVTGAQGVKGVQGG